MHGNAAEWTRTTYRPYPYDATATAATSRHATAARSSAAVPGATSPSGRPPRSPQLSAVPAGLQRRLPRDVRDQAGGGRGEVDVSGTRTPRFPGLHADFFRTFSRQTWKCRTLYTRTTPNGARCRADYSCPLPLGHANPQGYRSCSPWRLRAYGYCVGTRVNSWHVALPAFLLRHRRGRFEHPGSQSTKHAGSRVVEILGPRSRAGPQRKTWFPVGHNPGVGAFRSCLAH